MRGRSPPGGSAWQSRPRRPGLRDCVEGRGGHHRARRQDHRKPISSSSSSTAPRSWLPSTPISTTPSWCPAAHPSSSRESPAPRRTCGGSSRCLPLGDEVHGGSDPPRHFVSSWRLSWRWGSLRSRPSRPVRGSSRGAASRSGRVLSRLGVGGIIRGAGGSDPRRLAAAERALRDEGRRESGPEPGRVSRVSSSRRLAYSVRLVDWRTDYCRLSRPASLPARTSRRRSGPRAAGAAGQPQLDQRRVV